MKIIRADRAKGKTTELVKIANKKCMYILCRDRWRAKSIMQLADKLGLNIPFPVTPGELYRQKHFIREILIDDVEDVLEVLLNCKVDAITTKCEVEELEREVGNV